MSHKHKHSERIHLFSERERFLLENEKKKNELERVHFYTNIRNIDGLLRGILFKTSDEVFFWKLICYESLIEKKSKYGWDTRVRCLYSFYLVGIVMLILKKNKQRINTFEKRFWEELGSHAWLLCDLRTRWIISSLKPLFIVDTILTLMLLLLVRL